MSDDQFFRLMFLAVIAPFVPLGSYCRLRSKTTERLDRWQEGPFILFGLRLSGVPLFVGGVAWLIEPRWMAWASLPVPIWVRWAGLVIVAGWGVLLVWTFRHLGRNLTDTVVTRQEHTLVTSGPYRYVRHPFYLAFAVGIVGGSLVAANWFLLLAGVVPFVFLVARTRIEEEKLLERFGDDYRAYMKQVGRFWPRLPTDGSD